MSKLKCVSTVKELDSLRLTFEPAQKIGFVPTMGFLHDGHLSLVKKAREENDIVIVSIFINPTQFGPKEDLSRYPSDLERDLALLEKHGVDIVFNPSSAEIYPEGFTTYVEPTGLVTTVAEGKMRPGHFKGVATVVLKLFVIVNPHTSYFGQKDAQQVLVVSNMIRDLNLPVTLRVLPTVREKDGLAMSSRNAYLKGKDRKTATILYQSLQNGKNTSEKTKETKEILNAMLTTFAKASEAKLDYIEIRHAKTFEKLTTLKAPALLLIAAKIGPARLIDNFVLQEDNTWNTGLIL